MVFPKSEVRNPKSMRAGMIDVDRPDLSQVAPEVLAYIEALEEELLHLKATPVVVRERERQEAAEPPEPAEPPTPYNVITISKSGLAKRTPRHFYGRQRRGGMGVFDLETADDDPPAILTVAHEDENILLFTDFGRTFRLNVNSIAEMPVRARGQNLMTLFQFRPHERIVVALPADGGEYVALASKRGWVRRVPVSRLGRSLIPGMSFHDVQQGGYLTAACWTEGDNDLFMVSEQGLAIRFAESYVHKTGSLGMRVDLGDAVVGITAVTEESGVFLISQDGKGTIRLMSGFRANKAPGAGGKVAVKTENLVGVQTVRTEGDLFIITQLGKIIRFNPADVPPKEGVVQGVNCIALRNDQVTAVSSS
jgi:DNA gyrase subunit A